MKIKRVRVLQASKPSFWYADKIGEDFFAEEQPAFYSEWRYRVIPIGIHQEEPVARYLDEDDCEILDAFDGEIVKLVTMLIRNNETKP